MTVQKVKMVVLGDSGTGKTSIAVRYAKGEFDPHQKQTLAGSAVNDYIHYLKEAGTPNYMYNK